MKRLGFRDFLLHFNLLPDEQHFIEMPDAKRQLFAAESQENFGTPGATLGIDRGLPGAGWGLAKP